MKDISRLILPKRFVEGEIVSTINGEKIQIIGTNTVSDIFKSFEGEEGFLKTYRNYPMNSKVYYAIILSGFDDLSGVLIIHESQLNKN